MKSSPRAFDRPTGDSHEDGFQVTGRTTAGQADAGVLQGGGYALSGGFWGGGRVPYRIYLPLVLRQYGAGW